MSRNNVISVRLDDASLEVLDLLVSAGLVQSRSEAASHLIGIGIGAADELLRQARAIEESVKRVKREMMSAVQAKDVGKVKELLDRDESLVNARGEDGGSALLMSVYYGAQDVTEELLKRGAEKTLHEAAAVGNTARVRELLEEEPGRIDELSHDGWTPLHLAAFFGHMDTAAFLLKQGANLAAVSTNRMKNHPLHAALAGNRFDVAKLLIEFGADKQARDGSGWTPLHLAAAKGNKELVDRLLIWGDLNTRNDAGHTPLAEAERYGQKETAELLVRHGGKK